MSQQAGKEPTTRVLYVAGLYRSGSTILDIILGNHPDLLSVGELLNLPEIAESDATTCACGSTASECPFWGPILELWTAEVGGDGFRRLSDLQERFERLRSFPRLVRERIRPSPEFSEYAGLTRRLYEAIRRSSGAGMIVDSSKYPARAYALSMIPGVEVSVVHLVRDGRAVLWSCLRRPNTDLTGQTELEREASTTARTTRSWIAVNLLTGLVRRLGDRPSTRVRYEDLVTPPFPGLRAIGDAAGVDLSGLQASLSGDEAFRVGHLIAGNRVRKEDAVRIRADFAWKENLPEELERKFSRRAGWLSRLYGYR